MRQLTIEEKINIYEYAIDCVNEAEDKYDLWICPHLIDAIPSVYFNLSDGIDIIYLLPEFYNKKPKTQNSDGAGWWPYGKKGKEIRIKVLKEIIKELKEALK